MVGQALARRPEPEARKTEPENVAVRIKDLGIPGLVKPVFLDVESGEIIGIAGLVGSGRSELLEGLFSVRSADGTVAVDNEPKSPKAAVAQGWASSPQIEKKGQDVDRGQPEHGQDQSSQSSCVAVEYGQGRVSQVPEIIRIRTPLLDQTVGDLSGGNQQKVVIDKWVLTSPKLLLLDEPTRGVVGEVLHGSGGHRPSVAHDAQAVTESERLVQTVGDKLHCDQLLAQLTDSDEKALDLIIGHELAGSSKIRIRAFASKAQGDLDHLALVRPKI